MKLVNFILIFVFCISSFYAHSQESLDLKKGIINTTDGTIIKFNSLSQDGSTFSFTEPRTKINRTINQDQILSISKKSGDNTVLFAVVMGASGCLGAVLGANSAENDAHSQGLTIDKDAKRNTILILTGISTVAGAIWGAATPKYSKVYENQQYANRFIDRLDFGLNFGKETQLCLRYKF